MKLTVEHNKQEGRYWLDEASCRMLVLPWTRHRWQLLGAGDSEKILQKCDAKTVEDEGKGAKGIFVFKVPDDLKFVCVGDKGMRMIPMHAVWLRSMCEVEQKKIKNQLENTFERILGEAFSKTVLTARTTAKKLPRTFEKLTMLLTKLQEQRGQLESLRLRDGSVDLCVRTLGFCMQDINGVELTCDSLAAVDTVCSGLMSYTYAKNVVVMKIKNGFEVPLLLMRVSMQL